MTALLVIILALSQAPTARAGPDLEQEAPVVDDTPVVGFDLTLDVTPFVLLIAGTGLIAVVLRRLAQQRPVPTSRSGRDTTPTTLYRMGHERLDDELRDMD